MPEKNTTALVPIEQGNRGLVRAAGNILEAMDEYQKIQTGLDKAMPEAIITIGTKQFRRKPYWRAIATAFNLDVRMLEEKEIPGSASSADWGFLVLYRATAPNGRMADGDGSCFASEKSRGRMEATYHNVRSHAHTRAFNRAVSNLVGFGEVSAEEAERDEHPEPGSNDGPPPKTGRANREIPATVKPTRTITESQRKRLWAIAFNSSRNLDLGKKDAEDRVRAVCLKHGGFESTDDVTDGEKYEAICAELEAWGKDAA